MDGSVNLGVEMRKLVVEDLVEELVVEMVELSEGVLDGSAVVAVEQVEHLAEAVGGVLQQQLGVLETIAIVGEIVLDEGSDLVNLPDGCGGAFGVVGGNLGSGLLGQAVYQLGVEEALLAGLGLGGALLQLCECLGRGGGVLRGGTGGDNEEEQTYKDNGYETHPTHSATNAERRRHPAE